MPRITKCSKVWKIWEFFEIVFLNLILIEFVLRSWRVF